MAKDGGQDGEVMSAAELKPLLLLAKRQPVSCAIGMTRDKQGVILLHKRTKPRKLTAELLRQGKSAGLELDRASVRFGRASVDGGSDSTTVNFTINKEPAGPLHMKMVEKLRPAGFQRCEFTVDARLEDEGDEDETNEPEEGVATTRLRQDAGSAAYSPTAIPDAPLAAPSATQAAAPTALSKAEPDAAAGADLNGLATAAQPAAAVLKATLRGLTEQIRPVLAADPSRGASLVKIATGARDSLANGDLNAAQAGIDILRRQLEADGDGSPFKPSPALLTPALFSSAPAEPAAPTPSLASRGTMEAVSEGGAEVLGGLVLRFAVGAVSFVATLVIPTNTQRSSRGEAVDGRPNMAGTVTTAPGSRSGHVTIRLHGQHGQPDRVLGTFIMDPDGRLTDGVQGAVLGTVGVGSIHLTPEGEVELLRRAGISAGPASGTQPPSPTPSAPQQAGVAYETRNQEEADLAAALAGKGKSGQEIQAALDEHRRNAGLQRDEGGSGTGQGTTPREPSASELAAQLSGHGNARHGSHTTIDQQRQRLETDMAPDGYAPTNTATRFDSLEAQIDAVTKARVRTEARTAAGLIAPPYITNNGKLVPSVDRSVVTGYPGGYGSGLQRVTNPTGPGKVIVPTGQLPNARVIMERDLATGKWNLVTQYPTDEPVTP